MEKLQQSIFINAPREKVWDTMLGDATYREWTKAFNPDSRYEGSWEAGSKIRFVGSDLDGSGIGGMVSRVVESRRPEFVSLEHLGIIKDGAEVTEGSDVEKWKGARESYTFTEREEGTELALDMDINETEKAMMEKMWADALARLKALAEAA